MELPCLASSTGLSIKVILLEGPCLNIFCYRVLLFVLCSPLRAAVMSIYVVYLWCSWVKKCLIKWWSSTGPPTRDLLFLICVTTSVLFPTTSRILSLLGILPTLLSLITLWNLTGRYLPELRRSALSLTPLTKSRLASTSFFRQPLASPASGPRTKRSSREYY
jgi:hypothetical protein